MTGTGTSRHNSTRPRTSRVVALSLWACAGAAIAPELTRADGFSLTEQSARGLGMASAVSATIAEPAAVWYNPAALTFMPGAQASLTGVTYFGQAEFTPRAGGERLDAEPVHSFVPGLFATGRLSERVAVGLGVHVPFGLGVQWPKDWAGSLYGIESSILVVNVNPVASFKLLPNLSVAAGLNVVRGTVDITNGLPTSPRDTVRVAGAGWGLGANVAVLYQIAPELVHVAATYRSRVKLPLSGRAHFELSEPVFSTQLFDQTGRSELTLPDMIGIGLMIRPVPEVAVELDGNAVLWSTYDKVPVDFSNPATPDSGFYPNYHDVLNLRLGAEWATPLPGLLVRAGFAFHPDPAPDSGRSPGLPDAQAIDLTLGVGYHLAQFGVDLGYMLVLFQPSDARIPTDPAIPPQSPEGTYRTTAHAIGLTITGRLTRGT